MRSRKADRRPAVTAGLLVLMTGLAAWGLFRGAPEPSSFRMRVGVHRILYSVSGRKLVIIILMIGYRKDVYR